MVKQILDSFSNMYINLKNFDLGYVTLYFCFFMIVLFLDSLDLVILGTATKLILGNRTFFALWSLITLVWFE